MSALTDSWVYLFGSDDGEIVKVGNAQDLRKRRRQHETAQFHPVKLHFLAGVRGWKAEQDVILASLKAFRLDGGNNTETVRADPSVVEWINWLRQQYFTWTSIKEGPDDLPSAHAWSFEDSRRVALDEPNPELLVQEWDYANGELSGTAWARLARPRPPHNDYYTPRWLVDLIRRGMGGIDLDAASHWVAAREHGITNYFHQWRSAFDNPWAGRVWLNPPYGENKRWIDEIVRYWDAGDVTQLSMLSPVWAFGTNQAAPLIERSSSMLLLTPTPSFWGRNRHGEIAGPLEARFGSNMPHAIVYLGPRVKEMKEAFGGKAISMRLDENR